MIGLANDARSIKSQSGDISNNVYSLKMELEGLRNELDGSVILNSIEHVSIKLKLTFNTIVLCFSGTIVELAHYGNDDKKVEIKKVLKEAKKLLDEMKLDLPKRTKTFQVIIK